MFRKQITAGAWDGWATSRDGDEGRLGSWLVAPETAVVTGTVAGEAGVIAAQGVAVSSHCQPVADDVHSIWFQPQRANARADGADVSAVMDVMDRAGVVPITSN